MSPEERARLRALCEAATPGEARFAVRFAVPALLDALDAADRRCAAVQRDRVDALRWRDNALAELAEQDVDGAHRVLAAAGIAAGTLFDRVEDIIGERDHAERSAEGVRAALNALCTALRIQPPSEMSEQETPAETVARILAEHRSRLADARSRSDGPW